MPNSVQFACFSVSAVHKTKYKHCKANFSRLFISNVHDLQKKKIINFIFSFWDQFIWLLNPIAQRNVPLQFIIKFDGFFRRLS